MAQNGLEIDIAGLRTTGQRMASLLPAYRRKLTNAMAKGARRGMHDAMDEWKRESTNVAPLDKGTLRRGITTSVSGQGLGVNGEIQASAVEMTSQGRFDYAYYLHNIYPESHGDSFQNPTTPGTIPRFIDQPAEENRARWLRMVEDEIKAEMRAQGFRVR